MLFLLAPAVAAIIAVSDPDPLMPNVGPQMYLRRHHRSSKLDRYSAKQRLDRSTAATVARMTRLALLQRREAMLHDFLIAANTETPIFREDKTYRFNTGIMIGPTEVTQDFLGSPIIRARVTNLQQSDISFLLEAQLTAAHGVRGRAATAVSLHAGESRIVELLCPEKIAPSSLVWTTMQL